jgi:hypothetical protein
MPVEQGSVTLSTAAMATEASAAVPPSSSTRSPARLAKGWLEAVMPPRAATNERREEKTGSPTRTYFRSANR